MSSKICSMCNTKYSSKLDKCPLCGEQKTNTKRINIKILFGIILFILLILCALIDNYFETRCFYQGCYKKIDDIYCTQHKKEFTQTLNYLSDYAESLSKPKKSDLLLSGVTLDKGNKYSSYYHCTGSVTNLSSKTVKFVKIKVSYKTSSGVIVDTDWTYAVGSEGLAPNETVKWDCSVKKDYSIEKVSAEVIDFDF